MDKTLSRKLKRLSRFVIGYKDKEQEGVQQQPIDHHQQQQPIDHHQQQQPNNESELIYCRTLSDELSKKYEETQELNSILKQNIEDLQNEKLILTRNNDEKNEIIENYKEELLLCQQYAQSLEEKLETMNFETKDDHTIEQEPIDIFDLWTPTSLLKKTNLFQNLGSPNRNNDRVPPPSPEKIAKMATVTISSTQKVVSKKPLKYTSKWNRVGFKI